MSVFLWGVLPYLSALLLIGGLWYRHRFDQFGWTSRSSQIYEGRLLKVASPLFHFGILAVFLGHLAGLLIPKRWTDAAGLSQEMYHAGALYGGGLVGIIALLALFALIFRRRTNASVFKATTWNDKLMYVFLVSTMLFGMASTLFGTHRPDGGHHNYRETVSIWFRSLFTLHPNVAAMDAATLPFKIHVVIALVLIAIWPLTRLVHAFAAPVQYPFRPYVVYRSRGTKQVRGNRWQTVGSSRAR